MTNGPIYCVFCHTILADVISHKSEQKVTGEMLHVECTVTVKGYAKQFSGPVLDDAPKEPK